jgi:hypothetical protein
MWPPMAIGFLTLIALVLLPIGIGMYFTTIATGFVEQRYDNLCKMNTNNTNKSPTCNVTMLPISISKAMTPPIYMYYRIKGFYQNYRLFAKSRYDGQLAGYTNIATSDLSDCSPFLYYGDRNNLNGTYTINDVYMPCGLVAWAMFNDTFQIYSKNSTSSIICNGVQPENTNCTKKGIELPGTRAMLFKRGAYGRNFTSQYYGEAGHFVPDVEDEDFQVWITAAAMPDFRKLYRIINVPLNGTIYININQRWPVSAFGGEKSIILTTSSWIGGQNLVFSILNIAVGSISFLTATVLLFAFTTQYIVNRVKIQRNKASGYQFA